MQWNINGPEKGEGINKLLREEEGLENTIQSCKRKHEKEIQNNPTLILFGVRFICFQDCHCTLAQYSIPETNAAPLFLFCLPQSIDNNLVFQQRGIRTCL